MLIGNKTKNILTKAMLNIFMLLHLTPKHIETTTWAPNKFLFLCKIDKEKEYNIGYIIFQVILPYLLFLGQSPQAREGGKHCYYIATRRLSKIKCYFSCIYGLKHNYNAFYHHIISFPILHWPSIWTWFNTASQKLITLYETLSQYSIFIVLGI